MSEKNDNKVPNVPNLRFDKSEVWHIELLSKYAKKTTLKNKNNSIENIICNSAQNGLIQQKDFFDRTIVNNENTENYYVIEQGDFVYNPRKSVTAPYGPVNVYEYKNSGIVSPLYLCFKVDGIDKRFLNYYFKSSAWYKYIYENGDSGARHDRISIRDDVFLAQPIIIPNLTTQNKIAFFLSKIDQRIETQSKIIEDIETLRKWIINQQFACTATNAIGEFVEQTSERNKTKGVERVLSVSNKYGFINQSEQFEDREVASDDRTNYKIVRKNDFAFNPARINVGSIAKLDIYDIGIVSPMYICFNSNNKNLDADYLSNFFSSNSFKNALNKRLEGSVRQCLQFDAICDIKLFVPSLDEQISFVSKIKAITKKLTIEKDILSAYKKQKAYLLSNMFI